ncbi:hypothetical protein MON38_17520 [Hymenobacter sp. DH14]|uniref:Uncharacterized protein n=1 Tax=Hymenobacter cyanobacteriorum TaxID=2926463 RepID=A0A9X1VJ89_9BACT|nr:hypothetical protein [Hymenobacter cyanobacteriorum]MCI1189227.1 hypothetical protein [Hymenobacter cyanobacteriorum]
MLDFALAPSTVSYSTRKWDGLGAAPKSEKYLLESILSSSCTAQPVSGLALAEEVTLLSHLLHMHAAHMTDAQVSQMMSYISQRDKCREEAELAANPARQAGIERASQRLAERTDYAIIPDFELV